ncbi:hypothetical protein [Lentzea sp. NEAU-D7]|uniref:hypothetical protein n=1 Tax=Lentzea sp. NEAU-D7 TaxID=2994667 RepID=UPI00224BA118|nr:hypothetical protein [Lentzea sp. NEAU-D7]MCX2949232.1 hypothetical protein [Lentzea sp. NEAU-D7]
MVAEVRADGRADVEVRPPPSRFGVYILPFMSGTKNLPEPSGISPRWLIRLYRLSLPSPASGVVEDCGRRVTSHDRTPTPDGAGDESG